MNGGDESLVPEDFDLDAARQARSSTPLLERKLCPSCDSQHVHHRQNGTTAYRCGHCGAQFDEPREPDCERVVIKASEGAGKMHVPGNGAEPAPACCTRSAEWREVARTRVPGHEECQWCFGDGPDDGDRGGTKLATRLARASPDEVGGDD